MNQKLPDWYIPLELVGMLFLPIVAIIGLVFTQVFIRIAAPSSDVVSMFWGGLGSGLCGCVLLFFARLPLYRQRQFWTFGPRHLTGIHRRLYKFAYAFVGLSLLLLALVWLRVM